MLENVTQIRNVLELMSNKEFKNRYDVNEVSWNDILDSFLNMFLGYELEISRAVLHCQRH